MTAARARQPPGNVRAASFFSRQLRGVSGHGFAGLLLACAVINKFRAPHFYNAERVSQIVAGVADRRLIVIAACAFDPDHSRFLVTDCVSSHGPLKVLWGA